MRSTAARGRAALGGRRARDATFGRQFAPACVLLVPGPKGWRAILCDGPIPPTPYSPPARRATGRYRLSHLASAQAPVWVIPGRARHRPQDDRIQPWDPMRASRRCGHGRSRSRTCPTYRRRDRAIVGPALEEHLIQADRGRQWSKGACLASRVFRPMDGKRGPGRTVRPVCPRQSEATVAVPGRVSTRHRWSVRAVGARE